VFAGKPDEQSVTRFQHFTSEGLDIYVHPSLRIAPQGMEIRLDKWAFLRRLSVSGVSLAA
jgi:hypothetical protein